MNLTIVKRWKIKSQILCDHKRRYWWNWFKWKVEEKMGKSKDSLWNPELSQFFSRSKWYKLSVCQKLLFKWWVWASQTQQEIIFKFALYGKFLWPDIQYVLSTAHNRNFRNESVTESSVQHQTSAQNTKKHHCAEFDAGH